MSVHSNITKIAEQCYLQIQEILDTNRNEPTLLGLGLKSILNHFVNEVCSGEPIRFSNLFSQLTFIQNKYSSSSRIHLLRRFPRRHNRFQTNSNEEYVIYLAD